MRATLLAVLVLLGGCEGAAASEIPERKRFDPGPGIDTTAGDRARDAAQAEALRRQDQRLQDQRLQALREQDRREQRRLRCADSGYYFWRCF